MTKPIHPIIKQANQRIAATVTKEGVSPALQLRLGSVVATDPSTDTVSVNLSGDGTQIDGVPVSSATWPVIGDIVWMLRNGTDLLVIGAQRWQVTGRMVAGHVNATSGVTSTLPSSSTARVLLPTATYTLLNVPVVATRWYWLRAQGGAALNTSAPGASGAGGNLVIKTGVTISDGTDLGFSEIVAGSSATNSRFPWKAQVLWQAPSTTNQSFCVVCSRMTGTSFGFVIGSYGANDPGFFTIEEACRAEVIT